MLLATILGVAQRYQIQFKIVAVVLDFLCYNCAIGKISLTTSTDLYNSLNQYKTGIKINQVTLRSTCKYIICLDFKSQWENSKIQYNKNVKLFTDFAMTYVRLGIINSIKSKVNVNCLPDLTELLIHTWYPVIDIKFYNLYPCIHFNINIHLITFCFQLLFHFWISMPKIFIYILYVYIGIMILDILYNDFFNYQINDINNKIIFIY